MTLFGRGMFLGKLEKHQRSGVYLSERLASLGIIWDQLGTHLKLLKITALCGIEGSKGGPTIMGAAEVSFPAVPKMKNCFQQQQIPEDESHFERTSSKHINLTQQETCEHRRVCLRSCAYTWRKLF